LNRVTDKIRETTDLQFYLDADRRSLGIKLESPRALRDEIWRFQIMLRTLEYYNNCTQPFYRKPHAMLLKYKFHQLSIRLGFSIPLNVFGPGLSIAHYGSIVVNSRSRIGANCRIHSCVNIGNKAGYPDLAPRIGNNVYIGPGAMIFGDIELADDIVVGANAVVNQSFAEQGSVLGGIPAKRIGSSGSGKLLIKGAS